MPRVKLIVGDNDLPTTHPSLAANWHPTKNGDLSPKDVTYGSRKKVWWLCREGHETFAEINYRAHHNNCPVCTGKQVLVGFNDLTTTALEAVKLWHPTRNQPKTPTEFTKGSHQKVWWKCEDGHEWESPIRSVAQGKKCPLCSRFHFQAGQNDLQSLHPDLANEWHPSRNGELNPGLVSPSSKEKVWWRCEQGHEVFQSVRYRVQSRKCSACSGKRVVRGFNDLASQYPAIAAQWHPTKNGDLSPEETSPGSHKSAWWLCELGHETKQEIRYRVQTAQCKVCSGRQVLAGFNDLATTHPELAEEWNIDLNAGVKVTEVSYGGSKERYWWTCVKGHDFKSPVAWRVQGNGCPVCSNRVVEPGVNDLETMRPDLAKEWHPTRNGGLKPSEVIAASHKKVWWKHKEGHEWEALIYSRTGGNGCPVCSGRKTVPGVNDLLTLDPVLAGQWHPSRNLPLTPDTISRGSSERVWWICPEDTGHLWQASVSNRAKNLSGCPSCSQTGYDSTKPGVLYFIKDPTGQARKIGITNGGAKHDRLKTFKQRGWEVIQVWRSNKGQLIARAEADLLDWLRDEHGITPFFGPGDLVGLAGYSETFSSHYVDDDDIQKKVEEVLHDLGIAE